MDATKESISRKKKSKSAPVPFRGSIFSTDNVTKYSEAYAAASPYPHLSIEDFCDQDFLKAAREELINSLEANFKESDIYKVFQTVDINNLSDFEKCEKLISLREALFSDTFKNFIESVTKCPPLSPKVDCSCNVYTQGCHLLCHDDVITSRCISYILYLTDPESDWKEESGGALELYKIDSEKKVLVEPCKRLLPKWNSIVLFKVEPGLSFHSIQEVLTEEDHRLSISGWFHYLNPEVDNPNIATLSQLKNPVLPSKSPSDTTLITLGTPGDFLEEEDIILLKQSVNGLYLNKDGVDQIYKKFQDEGSIQLHNFLIPEIFDKIHKAASAADIFDGFDQHKFQSYTCGARGGWKPVGPLYIQRFMKFEDVGGKESFEKEECGSLLNKICTKLLKSKEFSKLIFCLTGCQAKSVTTQIRRFRPGCDYTIAQMESGAEGDKLDVVFTVVDDFTEEKAEMWQSGEIGGFEAYVLPDDEEEGPADVYGMNEEDGVLSINPVSNTLNLVLRDEPLLKFVKYVSVKAPGSRFDISAEYKLETDDNIENIKE